MFLAYSVTRRELGYYCLKDLKDGLLVKEWIDSKILIIPLSSFNNDIETIVVKENENKNKELSVFKKAILTGTCILVFGSSLFFNPKPVKSVGLPSVVSNRLSETEINQLSEMAKNGIGRPQRLVYLMILPRKTLTSMLTSLSDYFVVDHVQCQPLGVLS